MGTNSLETETRKKAILSVQEQRTLILQTHQGNEQAREKLLLSNYGLVKSIAMKFIGQAKILSLEDLIQEGLLALSTAIDKFDLTAGTKLSTYATPRIFRAIQRSIEKTDQKIYIPINQQELLNKYLKFKQQYYQANSEMPSDDLTMDVLDLTEKQLDNLKEAEKSQVMSLDEKITEDSESERIEFIKIEDKDYQGLVNTIQNNQMLYIFQTILKPEEYYIFYFRYFFEPAMKLEDLATELHITKQRVQQIQNKALNTIHKKCYSNKEHEFQVNGIKMVPLDNLRLIPLKINRMITALYLREILPSLEYNVYYLSQIFRLNASL